MRKFRVEYLQAGKLVNAGECELVECFKDRLTLKNSRLFYLQVGTLTKESRSELEKLLEIENELCR